MKFVTIDSWFGSILLSNCMKDNKLLYCLFLASQSVFITPGLREDWTEFKLINSIKYLSVIAKKYFITLLILWETLDLQILLGQFSPLLLWYAIKNVKEHNCLLSVLLLTSDSSLTTGGQRSLTQRSFHHRWQRHPQADHNERPPSRKVNVSVFTNREENSRNLSNSI